MQSETVQRVRRAISAMPDGIYEGADALDNDGIHDQPVEIRCRIEINGDQAVFDLRASADQTAGPVNTTRFIAAASVQYAVKAVLAPSAAAGPCSRAMCASTPPPASATRPRDVRATQR
jgi:N-methylhydantoinase B